MQELPEIERLARQLRRAWVGRRLADLPDAVGGGLERHLANVHADDLRPRLPGMQVQEIRRHGLSLFVVLRRGVNPYKWWVLQWGLSASGWLAPANPAAIAAGGVRIGQPNANFRPAAMPVLFHLAFDDGQRWAYQDQRRWGKIQLWTYAELVQSSWRPSKAGPDWLYAPDAAIAALQDCSWGRPAKRVLIEQRIAAGLGNVLACEVLHLARVHPDRPWGALDPLRKREVARIAAFEVANRVESDLPYSVYAREGDWCLRSDCVGTISINRDNNSTRRSFFCPSCQTAPGASV